MNLSSATARPTRTIDGLLLAGLFAVAGAVTRAIWFTPVEVRQGLAQKIFYIHVPSAFIALYIAFGLLAVSSISGCAIRGSTGWRRAPPRSGSCTCRWCC